MDPTWDPAGFPYGIPYGMPYGIPYGTPYRIFSPIVGFVFLPFDFHYKSNRTWSNRTLGSGALASWAAGQARCK